MPGKDAFHRDMPFEIFLWGEFSKPYFIKDAYVGFGSVH
jgi:hypothetical protein